MTDVAQNQVSRITVILTSLATGAEKTALVPGDITLYYRKAGLLSTSAKSMTGANFREVDATNMPGLYEIEFSAEELDTEGEFVAVVKENALADLAQTSINLNVVQVETDDQLVQIRTILEEELKKERAGYAIPKDTAHTATIRLRNASGDVTGLTAVEVAATLFKAGSNAATTAGASLTELNAGTLPGYYSITLGVADTDTDGDLLLAVEGTSGTLAVEQTYPAVSGTPIQAHRMFARTTLEGMACSKNGFSNGLDLIRTTDGGTTWAVQAGINAPADFTAVDGDRTSAHTVIAGNDSGSPTLFFTDDFSSWTPAPEDTFTSFDIATDVAWVDNSNSFMTAGGYILHWDRVTNPNKVFIVYAPGDLGSGSETFAAIARVDATTIVAVGEDSGNTFAVRSTNLGTSFATISPLTPTAPALDVDFAPGTTTGWVTGQSGTVSISTDGGATWTPQTSGVANDLNTVTAIDATTAWIAGAATGLRTTDGGSNWNTITSLQSIITAGTTQFFGSDGETGYLWLTGAQDGSPIIVRVDDFVTDIFPTSLRFFVGSSSVDLTPVTDALTEIKGAGFDTAADSLVQQTAKHEASQGAGFNTATDSLAQLRNDLDEIKGAGFNTATDSLKQIKDASVDLTPVTDALTEIKGAGFDTAADSLVQQTAKHVASQGAGFSTATDSLIQLRNDLDQIKGAGFAPASDSLEQIRANLGGGASCDLTPVLTSLTEIKGVGFDTATDALRVQRIAQDASSAQVLDALTRLLGLSQENIRITGHVYDVNQNLTQSTVTIYPSKVDTVNQTNPIAVYQMNAVYDLSNRLTDYSITREL